MKIAIVFGHLGRLTPPPDPPADEPRSADAEHAEHAEHAAALAGRQNAVERARELGRELGRQNHQVTIYTRRDDPDLPPRIRLGPGVTVEHLPAGPPRPLTQEELLPHMAEFGRHLTDRWANNPPDVVHAHFWLSGLAALAAARSLDIPVVQTYQSLGLSGQPPPGRPDRTGRAGRSGRSSRPGRPGRAAGPGRQDHQQAPRIRLERAIGRTADAVIATCSDQATELLRMGVPRQRIGVVPCGVDTRRFTPKGPSYPRSEAPRLLVLSKLAELKGVDTAIEALARVPDAELVIGGGPPRDELDGDPQVRRLRMLAKEAGVADRVTFLGRVPRKNVPQLLRSADLVLTLPWYEPFGMVPLEAMACGVPVVATEVGGHRDSLIDNVTGVHVAAGRPVELARRVRVLLADPTRRHAMGIAGADRARSRYAWERVARETASVYGRVARHRPDG